MVGRGTRADRKPTGLEGSQTSPRRLKLPTSPRRYNSGRLCWTGREASSGRPLYKVAALSVGSRRLSGMT